MSDKTLGPDEGFKMHEVPDEDDTEAHRMHGAAIPEEPGPDKKHMSGAVDDEEDTDGRHPTR